MAVGENFFGLNANLNYETNWGQKNHSHIDQVFYLNTHNKFATQISILHHIQTYFNANCIDNYFFFRSIFAHYAKHKYLRNHFRLPTLLSLRINRMIERCIMTRRIKNEANKSTKKKKVQKEARCSTNQIQAKKPLKFQTKPTIKWNKT